MDGVEASAGEVVQPFSQLRHERVCGRAEGLPERAVVAIAGLAGIRGGESLVELLLPNSGGTVAELGWPGGSQVARVDLGGGAPHLYVGDQLGRHGSVWLGRPGRRFTCGVEADLVGELSDQV